MAIRARAAVPDDASCCSPSATSLSTRRAFELKSLPSGTKRVVGASNGWLALSVYTYGGRNMFSLFNPVTGTVVLLPPLIYDSRWVSKSKLVFAPHPSRRNFAAATICDMDRLAYVTSRARGWAILDPLCLADGDQLADLVYREKEGRVYCLTSYGDVHVLRMSPGDLLNAAATVEPLLSLPFDADTSFAPPYNKVSVFTGAKNLVFCDGNLYQIWRNVCCTVTVQLSGGGRRRVAENEVFVLRYCPDRQPCWDAVTDLGGYAVFIGWNNAVSFSHAEGVPGLKGNCVYWIGGKGRDQGMFFDMATRSSTACLLPAAAGGAPQSTICWYILSDMMNNSYNTNGGERVYQTRAGVRADREKQQE